MELIVEIIIGLLILTFLVVMHELGHAITALRNGVVVEEFAIGFPPRIFSKKLKNGIKFCIGAIPLGGYVKLQGEHDAADKKGDYGAASFKQKTKILLAGVAANWLVAFVILTGLAITGLPRAIDNQFTIASDTKIVSSPVEIIDVVTDYPAEGSGLQSGDTIVRFADQEVPTVDRFLELTQDYKGQEINIIYNRDGAEHSADVNLRDSDSNIFGANLGQREYTKSTWSAPIVGAVATFQFTWETISAVLESVTNLVGGLILQISPDETIRDGAASNIQSAGDNVSGPVGILGTIFPEAEKAGVTQLAFLTAIISVSLAVMNVLPIPALDGGRWLVSAYFRLTKKNLTREREEKIQLIGFSIIMGLVVLITTIDVIRMF